MGGHVKHEELVQEIANAVEERRRTQKQEHALTALGHTLTARCAHLSSEETEHVRGCVLDELLMRTQNRIEARRRPHIVPQKAHFLDVLEERHDEIHLDQAS